MDLIDTPLSTRIITEKSLFKLAGISACVGIASGALCTLFLHSLNWIIEIHRSQPLLVLGLPIAGAILPFLFKPLREYSSRGMSLILEEVHNPNQWLPWALTPVIYLSTLLTHLVGGSAGREGTALQIATSVADPISNWFRISMNDRRWILISALSAGFGSAIGAPWAGMIFGLEVSRKLKSTPSNPHLLVLCFISSFSAWFISLGMKAPHFNPPILSPPEMSGRLLFLVLSFAVLIGLVSRFYSESLRRCEKLFHKIPLSYRTGAGGLLLLALYWFFPLDSYHNLGLESITSAFQSPSDYKAPLFKLLLTILTLSSGFKGGEFVPLVFIGSTMGSVFANLWQQPLSFFTALGYATLFGAAAKTPLTCTLLTVEFFGWPMAPFALLVNYAAYATAGPFGIYHSK